MGFDLRPLYPFDSSEGQIPEGNVSAYGPANDKANCVPASFTAALTFAGFPDVDPQRITSDVYGSGYRGGEDFQPVLHWLEQNIPNLPAFSDQPFDFDIAEAAGQAGKLMVIAGWIDAPSVRFVPYEQARGFSHASILAAHVAPDDFVIWNTWFGEFQTYSRSVIAASLYELSVMDHAPAGGPEVLDPNDPQVIELKQTLAVIKDAVYGPDPGGILGAPDKNPRQALPLIEQILAELRLDRAAIDAEIAALKGSPTVAGDPSLLNAVLNIEKALKASGTALGNA